MSSAEAVLALVSGLPSPQRGSRLFMVMQAYIDDSGSSDQSPIFVLAGFVASANSWGTFADEWRAVLDKEPKLDYFKMKEAARLHDQFSRTKGWNEIKRDERIKELVGIIRKHTLIRIHSSILNSDYRKYIKSLPLPNRTRTSDNPYVLLAMQLINIMASCSDLYRINEPCDFIFDEQEGFSSDLLHHWEAFKQIGIQSRPPGMPLFYGSRPIFRDEKEFLPLQASDLYAWHLRRSYVDNRVLYMPPHHVMRELDPIPVLGRNFTRSEMKRFRDHLIGIENSYRALHPDSVFQLAGSTKRERKTLRKRQKKSKTTEQI